ncbi:MAG: glycosyltransferase, partial [Candidatus Peribacteraceae bacterium]|nr:glycosyltransferase [Candidatus Peribacteraceae bacterium]
IMKPPQINQATSRPDPSSLFAESRRSNGAVPENEAGRRRMISIIIPTRNEEGIIGTTLSSLVAGLAVTPYEIIVTDGGSSDRTVAIARQYGATIVTDPRPERQTIARGRNLGAAAAKGDFLVFLDADITILHPDAFFQEALAQFTDRPNLTGLTGRLRVVPESETKADYAGYGYINLLNVVLNNFLRLGGAAGEFQMIRTEAFRQVGGYREHIAAGEDYELFGRLARIGRTLMHWPLIVFHTGRRPHKVGWPKLMSTWILNGIWVFLFQRSYHGEWKEVRSEAVKSCS